MTTEQKITRTTVGLLELAFIDTYSKVAFAKLYTEKPRSPRRIC